MEKEAQNGGKDCCGEEEEDGHSYFKIRCQFSILGIYHNMGLVEPTGFEPASSRWQPGIFYQLNYGPMLHQVNKIV